MKKILSFLALSLVIISGLLAQAPQKFTYQAVVRDSYNTLVPSKPVGVRISILQGGLNGPVVYSEQHTTVTNANGLMTLQIGGGVLLNGDFSAIDWAAGPYFLKTETDPQGGTNYTVTGAQQLLSVPYALYSEKSADSFSGDYNDLTNTPTIPTTTGELTNDAGFITTADIPDSVSYFVNDAGYITKDSIPNAVITLINSAGYLTKDSICAATASCGYITSADLNLFLGQINDKIDSLNQIFTYEIDSLKTIINTQAEKIDSLSGNVNNGYIPLDSTGLNPNDSKSCQGTPTVTDVDGNVYNTVQIGAQCWMRENLRTTHYADNTPIVEGSTTSTTVAYWYYPNKNSSNKQTYGLLYNWKAVMRNSGSSGANPSGVQGICPTGWHVPSDAEWTQLTDYVSSQNQYVCASTSSYIARSLAGQIGWSSSPVTCAVGQYVPDNNATGFSALPAGYYHGSYDYFGDCASFWSSTETYSTNAYGRDLNYNSADVQRYGFGDKNEAFSVRCLRD